LCDGQLCSDFPNNGITSSAAWAVASDVQQFADLNSLNILSYRLWKFRKYDAQFLEPSHLELKFISL
jgi:hypothetical protein